jgi:hypothetical protein
LLVRRILCWIVAAVIILLLATVTGPTTTTHGQVASSEAVRLNEIQVNEIQVLGSHNSYKAAMDTALMRMLERENPEQEQALDYAHPPLTQQLKAGLRSLELDVYYDPKGDATPHRTAST